MQNVPGEDYFLCFIHCMVHQLDKSQHCDVSPDTSEGKEKGWSHRETCWEGAAGFRIHKTALLPLNLVTSDLAPT